MLSPQLNRYFPHFLLFIWLSAAGVARAQETIYRCGNEYTNDVNDAKAKGCKVVIGGNVTVIQASKPTPAPITRSNSNINVGVQQRVESFEQRQRDADAKGILDSELRKAEQRLEQLRRDYNDGQPEKLAAETKNYQKYLDRVSEMRNQVTRAENDIASIKRELTRLSGKTPLPPSGTAQ